MWNIFVNLFGYDATIRLKDLSQSLSMLLAGIIIGGFFVTRFHHNLVQSPEIDKLGTMKIRGKIVSRPTTVWETIDTLTAIIVITLFPARGLIRRNMRRSRIVGRVLWVIAILLILFALVMSNCVILAPLKD